MKYQDRSANLVPFFTSFYVLPSSVSFNHRGGLKSEEFLNWPDLEALGMFDSSMDVNWVWRRRCWDDELSARKRLSNWVNQR